MKWAFAVQRKIRLAIFLAVMMFFILLFSLIEANNIARIADSFNSLYQDRLIPATDLHQLSDKIHSRRHQLVRFLFVDDVSISRLKNGLKLTDKELNRLIGKYEKTYLVNQETNHLARLKNTLKQYRQNEQQIILAAQTDKAKANELYQTRIDALFTQLEKHIMELARVQTKVGRELLTETLNRKHTSNLLLNLQLIIIIIVGSMIIILVITSKQVLVKQKNFNMN